MAKITEVPIEVFSNVTDLPTAEQRVGVADNVLKLINGPNSFLVGSVPTSADLPPATVGNYMMMAGGILYLSNGTATKTVSASGAISISSAALTTFRNSIISDPTLAPAMGTEYLLTDGLLSGKIVKWNGSSFSDFGPMVIASSGVSSTTPILTRTSDNATDATAVDILTLTIPGFLMSSKSQFVCEAYWVLDNVNSGSANTKTLSYKVNGGGAILGPSHSGSSNIYIHHKNKLHADGVLSRICYLNNSTDPTTGSAWSTKSTSIQADWTWTFSPSWGGNCAVTSVIGLAGYRLIHTP